jgi:high affinity Mn2+ porin
MKISLSSTFYLGFKISRNTKFYINPDIAGGSGIGGTLGIAAYPNGEIFRVGNPAPAIYFSRAFIRHYVPLKNTSYSYSESDQNQLGEFVPTHRLQLTIGKFTLNDIFDCNHYSHDPRTRFLNWALMNSGAYDFASNTKGYTYGIVIERITPELSLRTGIGVEPVYSNGPLSYRRQIGRFPLLDMEVDLNKNTGYGWQFEVEKPIRQKSGKPMIIRALVFANSTNSGKYSDAIASPYYTAKPDSFVNNGSLSIASVRNPGTVKYGASLNIEKPIGPHAGALARFSWNDGRSESFAFAEIDQSESLGFVLHGTAYHRYHDRVMAAIVVNQVSTVHRDYLLHGGYGFMLGEPNMRYASECVIELQYSYSLGQDFVISPDFQYILNPGYDANRGSIRVWGVRSHINF